jgi:hypothetical protein
VHNMERERMLRGGPVVVAPFYRCGNVVGEAAVTELRGKEMGSIMVVVFCVRGWQGDRVKVGSTVGSSPMAWRWAAGRCGT